MSVFWPSKQRSQDKSGVGGGTEGSFPEKEAEEKKVTRKVGNRSSSCVEL